MQKLDAGISNQIENHGFKIHELEAIDDKYIEMILHTIHIFRIEPKTRCDAYSCITKEINLIG